MIEILDIMARQKARPKILQNEKYWRKWETKRTAMHKCDFYRQKFHCEFR